MKPSPLYESFGFTVKYHSRSRGDIVEAQAEKGVVPMKPHKLVSERKYEEPIRELDNMHEEWHSFKLRP